jgi:hypothetical protein
MRSVRQRPGTADSGRPHGRYRTRYARRRVAGCRDEPVVVGPSPVRGGAIVCKCGRELCLSPYSNRWSAGIIAGLLTAYE